MSLSNGPNLGLLENAATGEAHDAALRALLRGLDGLVQPHAKTVGENTPPGSPANGDVHIVGTAPTGAWASQGNKVARYSTVATAWEFFTPKAGWIFWNEADSKPYRYSGSAWAIEATGGSGSSFPQIFPVTASVAANALTATLNATTLDFRSSTLGSGAVNTRTVASPISLTVASGATLGTVNGQAARLVLLAIDNAGTVELAIANIAGGVNLDETTLISTTALSGASDSASVVYSTTARTSVPFRVVGFLDITEATAGTWATAPSTIQGCGGQALTGLTSVGFGQTFQAPARSVGTTYYNTTGRPIVVIATFTNSSANTVFGLSINEATVYVGANNNAGGAGGFALIVPPGAAYLAVTNMGALSLVSWYELR